MSTKKPCDCCYTPNPACAAVTGSWSDVSGTWSTSSDGTYSYITCTSPGKRLFTPSSGLAIGERMGVMFYINGSSEFVAGFFLDATDPDNCHRVKITRTASTFTLALEKVVSGTPTTLDQWVEPITRLNGLDSDVFWLAFGEFEKQCIVSIADVTYDLGGSVNSLFPLDATYAKVGSGNKLGLFVDSFSGSELNFYDEIGFLRVGRVQCVSVSHDICAGTYAASSFPRHGLGDGAQVNFNVAGYSSQDDCVGFDFLTQTLDWRGGTFSPLPQGGEICGYGHQYTEGQVPQCTPPSGNGKWFQECEIEFHDDVPGVDFPDFREKKLRMHVWTTIRRTLGGYPGSIRAEFEKIIQVQELKSGNSISLPNTYFFQSGTVPFSGSWDSVSVTML